MDKIQVVILCAGKGTRLLPLTETIPKVLVDINGKSTLERNLDNLSNIALEFILIIGYLGDKIKEKIGNSYNNIPVKYIEQKDVLGTGHALECAKNKLNNKFLVKNGDDIHSKNLFEKIIKENLAIAGGIETENISKFAALEIKDNNLIGIEEKPKNPKSNIANIGVYLLNKSIFNHKLEKSSRGEYEITDYIQYLIDQKEKIKVITTDFWVPVGNHKELKRAKEILI